MPRRPKGRGGCQAAQSILLRMSALNVLPACTGIPLHVQQDVGAALLMCHTPVPLQQDVVAGDGTTSVTVLCGALLKKSLELLEKGVS